MSAPRADIWLRRPPPARTALGWAVCSAAATHERWRSASRSDVQPGGLDNDPQHRRHGGNGGAGLRAAVTGLRPGAVPGASVRIPVTNNGPRVTWIRTLAPGTAARRAARRRTASLFSVRLRDSVPPFLCVVPCPP